MIIIGLRRPFPNAKYQVWMNENYQKFLTYVKCIANVSSQCQSWRGPVLQEEEGGSRAGWVRETYADKDIVFDLKCKIIDKL